MEKQSTHQVFVHYFLTIPSFDSNLLSTIWILAQWEEMLGIVISNGN